MRLRANRGCASILLGLVCFSCGPTSPPATSPAPTPESFVAAPVTLEGVRALADASHVVTISKIPDPFGCYRSRIANGLCGLPVLGRVFVPYVWEASVSSGGRRIYTALFEPDGSFRYATVDSGEIVEPRRSLCLQRAVIARAERMLDGQWQEIPLAESLGVRVDLGRECAAELRRTNGDHDWLLAEAVRDGGPAGATVAARWLADGNEDGRTRRSFVSLVCNDGRRRPAPETLVRLLRVVASLPDSSTAVQGLVCLNESKLEDEELRNRFLSQVLAGYCGDPGDADLLSLTDAIESNAARLVTHRDEIDHCGRADWKPWLRRVAGLPD